MYCFNIDGDLYGSVRLNNKHKNNYQSTSIEPTTNYAKMLMKRNASVSNADFAVHHRAISKYKSNSAFNHAKSNSRLPYLSQKDLSRPRAGSTQADSLQMSSGL